MYLDFLTWFIRADLISSLAFLFTPRVVIDLEPDFENLLT